MLLAVSAGLFAIGWRIDSLHADLVADHPVTAGVIASLIAIPMTIVVATIVIERVLSAREEARRRPLVRYILRNLASEADIAIGRLYSALFDRPEGVWNDADLVDVLVTLGGPRTLATAKEWFSPDAIAVLKEWPLWRLAPADLDRHSATAQPVAIATLGRAMSDEYLRDADIWVKDVREQLEAYWRVSDDPHALLAARTLTDLYDRVREAYPHLHKAMCGIAESSPPEDPTDVLIPWRMQRRDAIQLIEMLAAIGQFARDEVKLIAEREAKRA